MRRPRVKVEGEGFYHVVSRIGGKRFLIDDDEKKTLLEMIRGAAAFSGVELYTFAIMSNHFHLLVRVPRKREVSDKDLEKRMLALYGPAKFKAVLSKWERWTKKHQESRVEDEKARMRARMYDLSQFCKTFKEAYTQDYNKRHENTGTIWEGRFKSILLEGSFRALMTVAGYVHLNPVRAAMVERPEEAQWTGYGAGCQGDAKSRAGLQGLVARVYGAKAEETTWKRAREVCADVVAGRVAPANDIRTDGMDDSSQKAGDVIETDAMGRPVKATLLRALLLRQSACFLHGGALGSAAFLKRMAGAFPKRMRSKADALFDRCPFLALSSASGVRETPRSA